MKLPSLLCSSRIMRWAPLRPTPGITVSAVTSSPMTAARSPSAPSVPSAASASFGPTPVTVSSTSNRSRAAVVAKP